jgi:quercetin dioxygenase-like cupin family protein
MNSIARRHFRARCRRAILLPEAEALPAAAPQETGETEMNANRMHRGLARFVALGAVALVTAVVSSSAFAGSCPADKTVDAGMGQKPGATMPKDVTDTVLSSIDLAKEPVKLDDHLLRLRRLVIQPGGVVPWHSHGDRPAIIYVVSGQVTEYASSCAVPILHKAGESTAETHVTSHWWKNTGKTPAVLLSADILHDPMDANSM